MPQPTYFSMRTRLLLPALLALPLLGAAQQHSGVSRKVNDLYDNESLLPVDNNRIYGSPFLERSWQTATVHLVGNMASTTTMLRYDIYRQELRVRRPQGDSVVVPLNRIAEFTLVGPVRRFLCLPAATLPAEVGGGCGEVLAETPQLQVLKFWRKAIIKESVGNGTYSLSSTRDVLEESTRLYLRWPADGRLIAVKPKRSSLQQALAGQPAALAALKARKGNILSEADLVAAVQDLAPTITASR